MNDLQCKIIGDVPIVVRLNDRNVTAWLEKVSGVRVGRTGRLIPAWRVRIWHKDG